MGSNSKQICCAIFLGGGLYLELVDGMDSSYLCGPPEERQHQWGGGWVLMKGQLTSQLLITTRDHRPREGQDRPQVTEPDLGQKDVIVLNSNTYLCLIEFAWSD